MSDNAHLQQEMTFEGIEPIWKREENRAKKRAEAKNNYLLRSKTEEIAFIPVNNGKVMKGIKEYNSYMAEPDVDDSERILQNGIYCIESELIIVLQELGFPIRIDWILTQFLHAAWRCNIQAKNSFCSGSYGKNQYRLKDLLLQEACRLAKKQEFYKWGWKKDPECPFYSWILYFEANGEQLSFHCMSRADGPDFPGEWNNIKQTQFPFLKELKPMLFYLKHNPTFR
ncbi:MAG: hypothetical protein AB2L14_13000 [Candidatus Xenobiia bacterium LiM19]